MGKRTWVQRPEGLVEVFREGPQNSVAPSIRMDVQPFRSPIDGSMISTRAGLNAHNLRHGVSNDPDSLAEKTKRHLDNQQSHGRGAEAKKERIAALVESYDRASAGNFQRRVQYED